MFVPYEWYTNKKCQLSIVVRYINYTCVHATTVVFYHVPLHLVIIVFVLATSFASTTCFESAKSRILSAKH